MASDGRELSPKQQEFVREYMVDLNATKAAERAGYSPASAGDIAAQLLGKTHVRAAIDAALAKRAAKTELTAERVLKEIQTMAFWDPADLVEIMVPVDDPAGIDHAEAGAALVEIEGMTYVISGISGARDIKKLPEGIRRAIVGWGYDKNQNFTLKLADKSKALDQLARHLALYNDKLDVNVTDNLADRVARAKARGNG